jgi:hypothetical protein
MAEYFITKDDKGLGTVFSPILGILVTAQA